MKLFLKKKFLSIYIPIFIVFSLVIGSVEYYFYFKEKKSLVKKIENHYQHFLDQQYELLIALFTPAITNLYLLSNQEAVINFMENPSDIKNLAPAFQLFTTSNKSYKQVRLLDPDGKERLRFNWIQDSIVFVPDSLLQDKGDRYYFKEALKLKPGEIYVSPIDLNIENDKIEIPYQRVIRYSSPIYNRSGELKGIIVINQYLNDLFDKLKAYSKNDEGNFMLLNNEGYWLMSTKQHKTFGFMIDSLANEKIKNYYPDDWKQIKKDKDGSINTEKGLFIFRNFSFGNKDFHKYFASEKIKADKSNNWFIAVHINPEGLKKFSNILKLFIIISISSFVIIFLLSYMISRLRYKEILYIKDLSNLNETLEIKVKNRTNELSVKNQELQKLNKELESFSYSVSHDLNAPLLNIKIYIEMLILKDAENLPQQTKEYLKNMKIEATNMQQMIHDMLNMSRVSRTKLKFELFEMNTLVSEVVEKLKLQNPDQIINWHITPLPKVNGDLPLLRQVWTNLISNAIKYSSHKDLSEIEIKATEEKDYFIFSIKDNGAGFNEEDSQRLFKSFQRLSNAKNFKGNGVGLSIVERIIANHQGKVWAEGELNKGACFYFSLPKNIGNKKSIDDTTA